MENQTNADLLDEQEQAAVKEAVADALNFQVITKVRAFTRTNNGTGEMKTTARFTLADGRQVFLSDNQVQANTGISKGFDVLKGSKMAASFYKKGEELINGAECTQDNTIVKEFEFELTDKLTQIKTAAAFGMGLVVN